MESLKAIHAIFLGKFIKILRECGADGWVEKYEKELAALS